MQKTLQSKKIFIAGHNGMVGSAILNYFNSLNISDKSIENLISNHLNTEKIIKYLVYVGVIISLL